MKFLTILLMYLNVLNPYNGIDVSHHNGTINWKEISKDSNVQFVYIKATEGKTFKDPKYAYNILEAKKQNILVGSYHFWRNELDGKEQFNHFYKVISKYNQDLIPVLDIEGMSGDRSKGKKEISKQISIFCELCKEKLGVYPIIYTDYWYFVYNLIPSSLFKDKWMRTDNNNLCLPFVKVQQYTKTRKIANKYVMDVNYCKNLDKIKIRED